MILSVLTSANLKLKNLELAKQKIDISLFLIIFGITLPLSSLLYWRLIFEYLNRNYFSWAYTPEDVLYTLYDKGTAIWFIILIMWFFSFLSYLFKTYKFGVELSLVVLLALIIFLMTTISDFRWQQISLYLFLLFVVNFLVLYKNTNFLYLYPILVGLYFVSLAQIDVNRALKGNTVTSIVLKSGAILLNETDKTRVYVGATSKYLLIYDKRKAELSKVLREDVE